MNKDSVGFQWIREAAAIAALAAAWFLAGCSGDPGHEGERAHGGHQGHAHHAPHGGALGMIGNHAFQLEIVVNKEAERLELYVLDGGAANFVRIPDLEIPAQASVGARVWDLRFTAMANEATGETKGNSSHFAAEAKGLVDEPRFVIRFDRLELLGQDFKAISIPYPEGSH